MWIRSQDKELLINVDGLKIENNRICIETSNWYVVLGKYSTKEKALTVLDKIVEEINYGDLQNVFQMPQDDEVEDEI